MHLLILVPEIVSVAVELIVMFLSHFELKFNLPFHCSGLNHIELRHRIKLQFQAEYSYSLHFFHSLIIVRSQLDIKADSGMGQHIPPLNLLNSINPASALAGHDHYC